MKRFVGNTVTVKLGDIKFICEIDDDIPNSIYNRFPLIDNDKLDDEYSFDNIGVVTFFRYCDEILDYDEYINKDIIELYNIIDMLNNNCQGEKRDLIVLKHNIREIKKIINEKETKKVFK